MHQRNPQHSFPARCCTVCPTLINHQFKVLNRTSLRVTACSSSRLETASAKHDQISAAWVAVMLASFKQPGRSTTQTCAADPGSAAVGRSSAVSVLSIGTFRCSCCLTSKCFSPAQHLTQSAAANSFWRQMQLAIFEDLVPQLSSRKLNDTFT